jgi:DNA-binding MarR family transcriptional regulator
MSIPFPEMASTATDELTDLLTAAARALRHRWRDQLAPFDIAPHQARALRLIAAAGSARPGRIAEELRITARSASDVVDALEARGLVTRHADPSDRRAVVVEPTSEGATLADELFASRRTAGAAFFAPLTAGQQHQLAALLTHLLHENSESDDDSVPPMA